MGSKMALKKWINKASTYYCFIFCLQSKKNMYTCCLSLFYQSSTMFPAWPNHILGGGKEIYYSLYLYVCFA